MLIAPGFAQGFPHDSSRPPPSAAGQYGLNVRAPFAAPRGSQPPCKPQPAAARGQISLCFPPAQRGWKAQRFTTLALQQHNKRSTTLARQRGRLLAGESRRRAGERSAVRRRDRPGGERGISAAERRAISESVGVCASKAKKRARGPRTFPGARDKLVESRLNGLK